LIFHTADVMKLRSRNLPLVLLQQVLVGFVTSLLNKITTDFSTLPIYFHTLSLAPIFFLLFE